MRFRSNDTTRAIARTHSGRHNQLTRYSSLPLKRRGTHIRDKRVDTQRRPGACRETSQRSRVPKLDYGTKISRVTDPRGLYGDSSRLWPVMAVLLPASRSATNATLL